MKTKRTRNVNSNQPSRSTWLDTLQILSLALLVRLLTTLTLWLVPLHLPAFDKSADAVLPPQDRWIQGFLRWDALYFLKIAEEGYTRENEFAFMPALPAVMRGLGMAWEERWMPSVKGMLLPAVVFANVAALGAAVLFHRFAASLSYAAAPHLACLLCVCVCSHACAPFVCALASNLDFPFDCCAIKIWPIQQQRSMSFLPRLQLSPRRTMNLFSPLPVSVVCWPWSWIPPWWPRFHLPSRPLSGRMAF